MKNFKQNFKRTLAAALASAMMITPCIAAVSFEASAEESTHTITIKNADGNADSTHSYSAYQIFSGKISETEDVTVLSDITWGNGVDNTKLLSALKASETIGSYFATCSTAEDVAKALEKDDFTDDKDNTLAFARIVGDHLGTAVTDSDPSDNLISVAPGYYFIKDNTEMSANKKDAVSRPILKVVKDVTINDKISYPTLDKVITSKNQTADGKQNSVAYGDKVYYKLNSVMPDKTGYDKYYFIVRDEYDENFTLYYNVDDEKTDDVFTVKIGDKTLTENIDYYIDNDTTRHKFRIIFKSFVNRTEAAGTAITIEYALTLSENATFKSDGYLNKADLQFSNNPNINYGGWYNDNPDGTPTPDDPTDDKPKTLNPEDPTSPPTAPPTNPPTGDTLDSETKSFPIKLKILKVDASNNDSPMDSVTFTLTGPGMGDDGKTFVTENGGQIVIEGLDIGTYKLHETKVPGYNDLPDMSFVISNGQNSNPPSNIIVYAVDEYFDADNTDANTFNATIKNNKGATLPSTGGIGTTIFYLCGGLLVAAGSVVLITKKRMAKEAK